MLLCLPGELTYKGICKLHNILKTNAKDMHTSLGGGNQGYLDQLLSDQTYALILPVPFIPPALPGISIIPARTAAYWATALHDLHKEALRLFLDYAVVKKALMQKLSKAIDPV